MQWDCILFSILFWPSNWSRRKSWFSAAVSPASLQHFLICLSHREASVSESSDYFLYLDLNNKSYFHL